MKSTNLDNKYASIPAEMFEPVNKDRVLTDQKIETKPVGYLADAFRRFKKNKGSVVAACILVVLLLFAIIAPFCTPYEMDVADGYYKRVRPKIPSQNGSASGFWDGTYVKDQPFQDFVNYNAIALGALYDGTDNTVDWSLVESNEYNPVKKVLNNYTQELVINGEKIVEDRYEYRIDSYYEVGFIAVEGLTEEQFNDILAWEEETGLKVLYPLVDIYNAEYYNQKNRNEVYQENYWYKHDAQNNPIDENGNILTMEQIKENGLSSNYLYSYIQTADGEYVCDGKNYYLVSELTEDEVLGMLELKSTFKADTKGSYAYKDGEYVLASTLSPEEQATNTKRYKLNVVDTKTNSGEYVFDGDQYKKVADLTADQLKTAYPRYTATFVADPKGTHVFYEGEYRTQQEMRELAGWTLMEWGDCTEKFKASVVSDANGAYVYYNKKYVLASSLTPEQKLSLVKYYDVVWDADKQGTHTIIGGELIDVSDYTKEEKLALVTRYNKELAMYKRTGVGGKNLTVRVLYYNYYQYLNGREPMFVFGADSQGYDILVRLAQGARLSFILALAVAIINLCIGIVYGSVQGYYGGKTDLVMEYISEILANVPTIIVVMLCKINFVDTGKMSQLGALILAFIMTGWVGSAYGVRMQFYRFKNQEYVLAARTLGASDFRLITKHIFPNAVGTLITNWAFVIPDIIFAETSFSYLGIINFNGTTMTSLGTMLSNGQAAGIDRFPHIVFFPALILSLLMISFNLFANGLRDAFNPSLRGSEG